MAYNTFGHIKRIPVLFTTVLLLCQFFLNLFDVYLYLMWLFRSENNFFSCCSLLKFEMVGLRWQKTNQLHVKLKHVWHNCRKKHYNIHFLWLHLKTLEYFLSMWYVYAYYPTYSKYKNNKIIYLFCIQLLHGECKITYHLSCPLFKKKPHSYQDTITLCSTTCIFYFLKKSCTRAISTILHCIC